MYENLKQFISSNINDNTSGSITPRKMRDVLNEMIEYVGENGQFIGIVAPSDTPASTDGKCFAIAMTAGTYTHFGNISVVANEVCVLAFDGSVWTKINLVGGVNTRLSTAENTLTQHTAAINGLSGRLDIIGVSSQTLDEEHIFYTKEEARKSVPADYRHFAHLLNYVYYATESEPHIMVEVYIGKKPKEDENFCDDGEWNIIKEEPLV